MMRRTSFGVLLALLGAGVGFLDAAAAVPVGENILLNGRFECDQTDLPLGWIFYPPKMAQPTWSPTGGPDGIPSFTLESREGVSKGERSIRQMGIRLSSSGRYKLSFQVRMRAFTGAGYVVVANAKWTNSRGVKKLPADTQGVWRRLETEFDAFPSEGGVYFLCIGVSDFSGAFEIADLRLEALDEAAAKGAERAVLSPYAVGPRIVPWVPLGTIPETCPEAEFRFLGQLPTGSEADYEMTLALDGREIGRQAIGSRSNRFRLPDGTKSGVLTVRLVHRASGSNVVDRAYRFRTAKSPSAANLARHVRLNSLVTEVLREKLTGPSGTFSFGVRRRGWVFIAVKAAAKDGFGVALDGQEAMTPDYPRHETFRLVEAGDHELKVEGLRAGDQVMVRSVPEIFNYCPAPPVVKENGDYGWAFQEKYVHPALTTHNGGVIPPEELDGFRRRGYRWVANMHSLNLKDADDLYRRLREKPVVTDPRYDGVSLDEQFWGRDEQNTWFMESLRKYDLEFGPEKPFYTWITGGKPVNGVCDADMIASCIGASCGRSKVMIEMYCRSRATRREAEVYLGDYIRDQVLRYRATYPNVMGSLGVILGNFNQMPVLTLHSHPETDYRYYLDMQLNLMANDPAFEDLSAVGYWGSYYVDRELLTWSFRLMRHYCVKGAKDMLSDRVGLSFAPGHVANGDFADGLAGWRAGGTVTADRHAGLGKCSEARWGGNGDVGDTFAEFARGERPNRLVQILKGLEPGRRYYLQFVTFDVGDLKAKRVAPREIGLAAAFARGAAVDEAASWRHVDRRAKGRYAHNDGRVAPNLHHVIFTAQASEAELVFSDAAAKPGETLGLNAVGVYLELPD